MKKPVIYFLFRRWLKFFNFSTATGVAFLLQAQAGTYDSWIASKGLSNSESTADPDHDGVPNIMEFVIGSEPNPATAGASSTTLLPTCTSVDGKLTLVLKRNIESRSSVNLYLQWSTDLSFSYIQSVWISPVSATTDGVIITVATNTPNTTTDTVTIKVPAAKAAGKKLYGRLQAYVSTPAKNSKLGGYLTFPATGIVEPYNAGFSMYTAAWPIVDTYPGHEFQTGLFGTWMYPKQLTKPPQEFNSNVEGGLGWWGDTRFPTLTPSLSWDRLPKVSLPLRMARPSGREVMASTQSHSLVHRCYFPWMVLISNRGQMASFLATATTPCHLLKPRPPLRG